MEDSFEYITRSETEIKSLPMDISDTINNYIVYNEYARDEIYRMGNINMQDIINNVKMQLRDGKIEELLND